MLDFLSGDMTQTILLSLYFVESYRDERFCQGSPPIRYGDVRACKRNVLSNVYAFVLAIFSGMYHTFPTSHFSNTLFQPKLGEFSLVPIEL